MPCVFNVFYKLLYILFTYALKCHASSHMWGAVEAAAAFLYTSIKATRFLYDTCTLFVNNYLYTLFTGLITSCHNCTQ